MKKDNHTPDLFGKPTAQDKYDARQRHAAHWVPVIRAILNHSYKSETRRSFGKATGELR